MKDVVKKHKVFLCIFILALFLRAYRLDTLTTFGHDQGIDFSTVRSMILNHHIPLIGIKVSFSEFFQGPVYLYILLPFFIIFGVDPLSGPIAAVFVSMITLLLLYFVLTRLDGEKTAVIGSLLYTVSPQFIKYGNTPLYQHFTPLFLIPSIYLLYKAGEGKDKESKKKNNITALLAGFFVGLSMETHFLTTPFYLTAILFFIWKRKNWFTKTFWFTSGLIIGILPTLTFEIRHHLLNTRYFIQYVTSSSEYSPSISNKLATIATGAGNFFGAENKMAGIFVLIIIAFSLLTRNKKTGGKPSFITQLWVIQLVVSIATISLSNNLGWWYILPFWIISLFQLSKYFADNIKHKFVQVFLVTVVIMNALTSIQQLRQNHGYYMPDGWSMEKIKKVANIIQSDAVGWQSNFNILSLVEGDTRAYSLRYTLETMNKAPAKVTDYNQNNALYVVYQGNSKSVTESLSWEIQEFSPYTVGYTWDIGDNIFLCRLDKIFN